MQSVSEVNGMFIGREKELKIIENRISSNRFEFGILYGRRRIGKTTLLKNISQRHHAIYFVCNSMGLDYNLNQLSQTIALYFDEPITFDNFESVFSYLSKKSSGNKITFILDEFTYLMESDSNILSVIQNSIDQFFVNSNICFIISGSHVGMVEEAISYKKPLYGRSTFKIKLEAFNYLEASQFYPKLSPIEKIELYSIFGGVAFYLNQINPRLSVKENILNLIIENSSIFEDEINFFLSQEVRSESKYGRILSAISSGATRLNEISTKSGNIPSGQTVSYINTLINLGIIERENCFGTSENSRKTIYRIKDPLFRFHYTFIEKYKSQKILMNPTSFYSNYIENYLNEFISIEFENIAKQFLLLKHQTEIEAIGRYWANDARKHINIEIDVVTSIKNELICYECKWTNDPINMQVVHQLEDKSDYINSKKIAFFSKSGYTKDVQKTDNLLYSLEDLFEIQF